MRKIGTNLLFVLMTVFFGAQLLNAQLQPPTNLRATSTFNIAVVAVKLNWDYANTPSNVTFSVYRKNGNVNDTGSFKRIVHNLRGKEFFDFSVQPARTFSYYVTAVQNSSESNPSNTVTISLTVPVVRKGVISGLLTDETTGQPIRRGKVVFQPVNSNSFSPWFTTFTDTLGRYSRVLTAGNYVISYSAHGYLNEFYNNVRQRSLATTVTLNENDSLVLNVSLAKFVPPPTFTLSGSVKDASGNPVRSQVSVFRLNRVSANAHGMSGLRTDSLGNFSFRNLNVNDTVVVFAVPSTNNFLPEYYNDKATFQDADRIVITANVTGIDFVVNPRPVYNNLISGNVKDTAGNAVIGNVIALRLRDATARDSRVSGMTDSLGVYSLNNLRPGKYLLLTFPRMGFLPTYYRADGRSTFRRNEADTLTVTETSNLTNMNFVVRRHNSRGNAIIAGNFRNASNANLNGVMVFAVDENLNLISYSTSDAQGNFVIEGLAKQNYTLVSDLINHNLSIQNNVQSDEINSENLVNTVLISEDGVTSVKGNNLEVPSTFTLSQNYPNPFNPSTRISFSIANAGVVSLTVYNVLGNEVAELVNGFTPSGDYSIEFDGTNLSSGIYFYKLSINNVTQTRKMMLLK